MIAQAPQVAMTMPYSQQTVLQLLGTAACCRQLHDPPKPEQLSVLHAWCNTHGAIFRLSRRTPACGKCCMQPHAVLACREEWMSACSGEHAQHTTVYTRIHTTFLAQVAPFWTPKPDILACRKPWRRWANSVGSNCNTHQWPQAASAKRADAFCEQDPATTPVYD